MTDRSGRQTLRADVYCGRFVGNIIAALDHSLIDDPDIADYTELAVVRRKKSTEHTTQWAIDGARLAVI